MISQEQQAPSIKLLFVGDVMLGRIVNEALKEQAPAYPWGDTLPLFQTADVRLCNLECALCDGGRPWRATPKVFHFRTDAKNVAVLIAAHIDAVSLANNHILDFEVAGLLHTLDTLTNAGIYYAGAGPTLQEASAPAVWRVREKTIGLLACTDNEPAWAATETGPGVCFTPIQLQSWQAQQLLERISLLKSRIDLLIVSLHWGPNWGYAPPAEHIPFAHSLIDAGADIIFGHSGHVVRGIEIYKERPILYCAGDFIDDYMVDATERNDHSGIFFVETAGTAIARLRFYPTIIDQLQANLAQNHTRTMIATKMQRLCADLHTQTTWNEQTGCVEIAIR